MNNQYNNLFVNTDVAFKDGVVFHGQPMLASDGIHICQEEIGDEVDQYLKQSLRPIFIGKDTPDDDEYDLRAQSLRKDLQGTATVRQALLKNCCRWHYAIVELIENGNELPFSPEDSFLNEAHRCWESRYVARINMKKDCGGKTCNEAQMRRYLKDEAHAELVRKQLQMLNPNVIVLMDGDWTIGRNLVMDAFNNETWHEASTDSDGTWIRYTENRILIQVYHPSGRVSDEQKYNMLVKRMSAFIKSHHNLMKSIFG